MFGGRFCLVCLRLRFFCCFEFLILLDGLVDFIGYNFGYFGGMVLWFFIFDIEYDVLM